MIFVFLMLMIGTLRAQNYDLHTAYHFNALNAPLQQYTDVPPAPWQSVRLLPYGHIQVDIKGSLEELKSIDLLMVQRDLWRFTQDYEPKAMELIAAGYEVRFHTSMVTDFKWVDNNEAWDGGNCPNPCNGWYMYKLPNDIFYAQKQFDDKFIVSFVQFVIPVTGSVNSLEGDVIINGTLEVNPKLPVRSFLIDEPASRGVGSLKQEP